jgi:hypothetical protein
MVGRYLQSRSCRTRPGSLRWGDARKSGPRLFHSESSIELEDNPEPHAFDDLLHIYTRRREAHGPVSMPKPEMFL